MRESLTGPGDACPRRNKAAPAILPTSRSLIRELTSVREYFLGLPGRGAGASKFCRAHPVPPEGLPVQFLQEPALLEILKKSRVDKLFRLCVLRPWNGLGQVVKRVLHPDHINIRSPLQNLSDVKFIGLLEEEGIVDFGVLCDGFESQFSVSSGP